MPIECVNSDVGLGAGEQFVVDAIPLQNPVPLLRPSEARRVVCPETFGIFQRARAFSRPVFLYSVADYDFWRCIFFIQSQQVGNVFWLSRAYSAHAGLPSVRQTG